MSHASHFIAGQWQPGTGTGRNDHIGKKCCQNGGRQKGFHGDKCCFS